MELSLQLGVVSWLIHVYIEFYFQRIARLLAEDQSPLHMIPTVAVRARSAPSNHRVISVQQATTVQKSIET